MESLKAHEDGLPIEHYAQEAETHLVVVANSLEGMLVLLRVCMHNSRRLDWLIRDGQCQEASVLHDGSLHGSNRRGLLMHDKTPGL